MRILNEFEIEKTFVERAPLLGNDGWDDDAGKAQPAKAEAPAKSQTGSHAINEARTPVPAAEEPSKAAPNPFAVPLTRPVVGKTRLGSGLVTDTIGSGGMASIYLVWNERLEVFRAVKMMSLDTLYDRFETEIKITAKMRHPNIVEIYSVGEWNGVPYMEMEYVDGENLQQALNRYGRFPDAVCSAAAICMANALAYAHNLEFTLGGKSYKGIIHRDLKPANIMFSKSGEIKLTDFGIARPMQASLHTTEGNIVGTLHYLSPEQMGGGSNVDHRSDIYSFGTLLYEMATGARTFPQESVTELMRRRTANSFKKPSEYNFPINSALANIIMRCLEADPKDRYRNIESLLRDLHKTHDSLCSIAPEKVIPAFYPQTAGSTPFTQIMAGMGMPKTETAKKTLTVNISMKKGLIALAAALALFLMTYSSIRLLSPNKPGKEAQVQIASNKPAEVIQVVEIDVNAPPTAVVEAPPVVVPKPEPEPAAESKPAPTTETKAVSEDDLIRSATAALNRKDWDQAARILERNVFKDKKAHRTLLLLEACVESMRLDRAQTLLDSAAATNDAHYFLSAGKYWFHRKNYAKSAEMLEASLTRPSVTRSKNLISDDAIYYIAMAGSERFKAVPSNANRLSALDGWHKVQSAYGSKAKNPRLERAEKEIAALN